MTEYPTLVRRLDLGLGASLLRIFGKLLNGLRISIWRSSQTLGASIYPRLGMVFSAAPKSCRCLHWVTGNCSSGRLRWPFVSSRSKFVLGIQLFLSTSACVLGTWQGEIEPWKAKRLTFARPNAHPQFLLLRSSLCIAFWVKTSSYVPHHEEFWRLRTLLLNDSLQGAIVSFNYSDGDLNDIVGFFSSHKLIDSTSGRGRNLQ